ncbi:nuclear transport factor 2 family protein [Streptosporangium sp. G11]|uniref:nuclear transport factor 2 family protein n=1 Tax=Streptosporangium sp. G11 TaxID=3436926 RepID=UPI003EBDB8DB
MSVHMEQRFTEFLTSLPEELVFGDEDPGKVLDRYYVPDFEYRNDGILLNRQKLIDHVRPTRKNVVSCRVEVHETLLNADRVAARYTLHAVMRKGKVLVTQVYMFGLLAPDGRIRRIDSITRVVPEG